MKQLAVVALVLLLCARADAQTYKALFDNSKNETAGNADWIIDTDQPIPAPAQSGITASTSESYWLGAISAWGVELVKRGFVVHTLTASNGITYGNSSNLYDLSKYNLFIVCEPQSQFTASEKAAIKAFVQNGGGLMMVADHDGSDRNSDGWDSPKVWNDLRTDSLFGIHFQSTGETDNNFSEVSTNVASSDPLISGTYGSVTALSYHNGTSMTILPTVNPNAAGHIWRLGAAHGNSKIMFATSKYGAGKVAGVGDSSPADDGSAQPGNSSIYDGWGETGATDSTVFLNACRWLVTPDGLGQVTLASPADLAANVSIPAEFRWQTLSGATEYQFDLSTSNGFGSLVATDSTLTDTTKSVGGLSNSTTYYWRVRGKNGSGWAAYSATRSFTTAGPTYTIAASAGANGSISPAGSVSVIGGNAQAFTITPSSSYRIDSVLVDGSYIGVPASYTFTNVSANHSIRAVFVLDRYQITASAGPNGSISPAGDVLVAGGASQAFTITPATGYHVDSLLVDEVFVGTGTSYTFSNVSANHLIRAAFAVNTYQVTASAGSSGSIAPSGTIVVNYGDSLAFSIMASPGHQIEAVTVDGSSIGAVASYIFTSISANHSIVATFTSDSASVTASAGPHGTISPSGLITVLKGTALRFTFQADSGYHTDSILVDGVDAPDSIESYTFAGISADHTLRVVFASDNVSVSVHYDKNWNLVSLPVAATDAHVSAVVPGALSPVYRYEDAYISGDTLAIGGGYWVKCAAIRDTSLTGGPIESLSIPVRDGWNLIGAITAPVVAISVTSNPPGLATSSFYGYHAGYQPADTLQPGKGYWIKSTGAGNLIFAANSSVAATARQIHLTRTAMVPPPPPGDVVMNDQSGMLVPTAFALGQAYPNPFNPSTTITYDLPVESSVSLSIYNTIGQRVATLIDGIQQAGTKRIMWDAAGSTSGVYFYRLEAVASTDPAMHFSGIKKILLMK